ncbi:MAG: hypothetical protein PHO90_01205 [Candidatus Pacebacteria bacterium]|nr:hypothetical protein [Candidatus Paceibacterota bacterium]
MEHPTIKLQFDQRLDQDMAWSFYNNQKIGGCDFWKERALRHHPLLINIESAEDKRKYLDNYISEYYVSHKNEIESLSNKTIEYLKQEQEKYFLLVDKIFKNYPWPKKELIGNFSIFDFCPRFIEDGEFQVFIYDNRNLQLFTIFHECLHFIFYDFAQKNFPETLGKMNIEEGKFWDLAEVFNAVIQNTDDFIDLHGKIENTGYPDHKDLIAKGALLWEKYHDVYAWISEMLKF